MRTVLPLSGFSSRKPSGKPTAPTPPLSSRWYSRAHLSAVFARKPAKLLALLFFVIIATLSILVFASGQESNTLSLNSGSAVYQNTTYHSATSSVTLSAATTITVDYTKPLTPSHLSLGVTHTQYSLDSGNPAAVSSGKQLLGASTAFQNQNIYGWGATNPEPSPGLYDFASLDKRINLILSMGKQPVITLCGAPDWMTAQGTNTSNFNLQDPPTPAHYADFANLAQTIAQRYQGKVHYYQVWSELRGFFSAASNDWDMAGYTSLYNQVYSKLKSVDSSINVGGPYLPVEGDGSVIIAGAPSSWASGDPITTRNKGDFTYFLTHATGADFIDMDRAVYGAHSPIPYTLDQIMQLTTWYKSITTQLASLIKTSTGKDLPIWWSEDYAIGYDHAQTIASANDQYQNAALTSLLINELLGGAYLSLRWQPQGVSGIGYNGDNQSLFSDVRNVGGGQPFPFYASYKNIHDNFGPGTTLYTTHSSSADVEVLASATHTLLDNKRNIPLTLSLNGIPITLQPFEVQMR